jgi:hypothetical protein
MRVKLVFLITFTFTIKKFLQTHPPITKAARFFHTLNAQPRTGSSSGALIYLHANLLVNLHLQLYLLGAQNRCVSTD